VPSAGDAQNGPFGAGGLSMMVRRMERVLGSVHGMLWGLVPQVESCNPSGRPDDRQHGDPWIGGVIDGEA
jgi:hypothetical protein